MSLKGTNRSHRKGKEPRSVLIASALSAMLWMGALTSSLCLALWLNPFTPVAAFAAETSVENSAKNSPETPAEKTAIASEETNSSKAAEMVDLDRRGSISLTFTYYDETSQKTYPVTGGYSVGLYKVADVIVDNGFKFKTDERFSAAGEIPATDEALDSANQKLAADMAKIASGYDYDVKPQAMDAEGKVYFDGLEVGLYLVKQTKEGSGDKVYTIAPFLISIPARNTDGSLSYDVDAKTKPVLIDKKVPPEPEKPDKPGRKLPQTGQLWWPSMVMGAAGALFIIIGLAGKAKK